MTQFLSEDEFQALMTRAQEGEIDIKVPKDVARQFFTHMSNQLVQDKTGESILKQKFLIGAAVLGAPASFIAALALILDSYGPAFSGVVIPIIGICWIVIYGLTSQFGGWLVGTLPLAASLVLLAVIQADFTLPLFLILLSIWLQRATYIASSEWLSNKVLHSYAFYEALEAHIDVIEQN